MNAPQGTRRAIYFRWWFWLGLVILLIATVYAKSYFDWRGDYDVAHTDDYARGLAAQLFKYQADRLEEQYRNDTYGGDTPEETLRLFVEAIEKKDFDLATRYYLPEKQVEARKNFSLPEATTGILNFISAYRRGKIKEVSYKSPDDYGIEVYAPGSEVPYYIKFVKNTFTGKWKIEEP